MTDSQKSSFYVFVSGPLLWVLLLAARPCFGQDTSSANDFDNTLLAAPPKSAEKAESLSLDELLARGLAHHPEIAAAKAKIALANAELNDKRMEIARNITQLTNQLKEEKAIVAANTYELELNQQAAKKAPGSISEVELKQKESQLAQAKAGFEKSLAELRLLAGDMPGVVQNVAASGPPALQIPHGLIAEEIKKALDEKTDLQFADNPTPLNSVMDYIAAKHKIPIFVHLKTPDPGSTLVSIKIQDAPLRYALEAFEDEFDGDIKFVVRDYGILLVGKEDAAKNGFVSAITFGQDADTAKPASKSPPAEK